MQKRIPDPYRIRSFHNNPVTILPKGTTLNAGFTLNYLTTGGMAIIYTASKDDKKYIVKEVRYDKPKDVIALNQEKATLDRLNHPNIVKAHALFEEDNYYYLVLDYMEGETLEKTIFNASNFISEERVINWAIQLCDILDYLHNLNPPLIYRDLKPSNIVLTNDERIMLIDFGIARLYKEQKTVDTELLGSLSTASPEHYGERQTDARSDIYTLGATLYFTLTKRSRSLGKDLFDFPPARKYNSSISEMMEKIIAKALEFEPERRFQSALEMKKALQFEASNKDKVLSAEEMENLWDKFIVKKEPDKKIGTTPVKPKPISPITRRKKEKELEDIEFLIEDTDENLNKKETYQEFQNKKETPAPIPKQPKPAPEEKLTGTPQADAHPAKITDIIDRVKELPQHFQSQIIRESEDVELLVEDLDENLADSSAYKENQSKKEKQLILLKQEELTKIKGQLKDLVHFKKQEPIIKISQSLARLTGVATNLKNLSSELTGEKKTKEISSEKIEQELIEPAAYTENPDPLSNQQLTAQTEISPKIPDDKTPQLTDKEETAVPIPARRPPRKIFQGDILENLKEFVTLNAKWIISGVLTLIGVLLLLSYLLKQ